MAGNLDDLNLADSTIEPINDTDIDDLHNALMDEQPSEPTAEQAPTEMPISVDPFQARIGDDVQIQESTSWNWGAEYNRSTSSASYPGLFQNPAVPFPDLSTLAGEPLNLIYRSGVMGSTRASTIVSNSTGSMDVDTSGWMPSLFLGYPVFGNSEESANTTFAVSDNNRSIRNNNNNRLNTGSASDVLFPVSEDNSFSSLASSTYYPTTSHLVQQTAGDRKLFPTNGVIGIGSQFSTSNGSSNPFLGMSCDPVAATACLLNTVLQQQKQQQPQCQQQQQLLQPPQHQQPQQQLQYQPQQQKQQQPSPPPQQQLQYQRQQLPQQQPPPPQQLQYQRQPQQPPPAYIDLFQGDELNPFSDLLPEVLSFDDEEYFFTTPSAPLVPPSPSGGGEVREQVNVTIPSVVSCWSTEDDDVSTVNSDPSAADQLSPSPDAQESDSRDLSYKDTLTELNADNKRCMEEISLLQSLIRDAQERTRQYSINSHDV